MAKKSVEAPMVLSEDTIGLLKHFTNVNHSIMILPQDVENGHTRIYSQAETHAMVASAIIPEEFKVPFVTSDLGRFLSMVSLFDKPSFDFHEDYVNIKEEGGHQKVTFYNTPKQLVEKVQRNKLPDPEAIGEVVIEFALPAETLEKIKKAADMLANPDLRISAQDGKVKVLSANSDSKSTNTYEVELDCGKECEGEFTFKKANFLVRPIDYVAKIYDQGVMCLISQSSQFEDEVYWIVAEFPKDE